MSMQPDDTAAGEVIDLDDDYQADDQAVELDLEPDDFEGAQ